MPRRREEDEDLHRSKRRRSAFIDDVAEEDDGEEEEDYYDDEEDESEEDDYDDDGKNSRKRKKRSMVEKNYLDTEAIVDSDEEETDEERESDDEFIDKTGDAIPEDGNEVETVHHHRPYIPDDDEDIEEIEKRIEERYSHAAREYDYYEGGGEEFEEVEQQSLLPSVKDPKLWFVRCAIGKERQAAVCLMQKFMDKGRSEQLQIFSAVALNLKGYIYVEAEKAAHVKMACKGLNQIFSSKVDLVPIKEMTDVLSVHAKGIDIGVDLWVRLKTGTYKGDIGKVVEVDDVKQRVTVQVIPRIDLWVIADKLDGREGLVKKAAFVPPQRFLNIEEATDLGIRVGRYKDRNTGYYFEKFGGMKFRDGFLFKTASMKSINWMNIVPTLDELEKFQKPSDMAGLSGLSGSRKRGDFRKGDSVIVVKGDLQNLTGRIEKVEEENVHLRSNRRDLTGTIVVNAKYLCKYFKPGDHVKVVSGAQEGATGMVFKVDGNVILIVSDSTKEDIRVFADNVVESTEVATSLMGTLNIQPSPARPPRAGPPTAFGGRHRVGKGHDSLIGATIKVLSGQFKGYRGRIKDVNGDSVRLELDSHMRIVTVKRNQISSNLTVTSIGRETPQYGLGNETPMRYVGTPLRPCATPTRDQGPNSIGMRTPMRDSAWNPMTPQRLCATPMRDPRSCATPLRDTGATPIRSGMRTPMCNQAWNPMTPQRSCSTPMRDPGATPIRSGMRTPMHDQAWNRVSSPTA